MCILDANILIDLNHGGILETAFQLPLTFTAPDPVWAEVRNIDRERLEALGLKGRMMTPEELYEVGEMAASYSFLSVSDCSALVAAQTDGTILLTGDSRLRQRAEEEGVEVHGVLWLLDLIEDAELLPKEALAESLHQMLVKGARLPEDECQVRLQRWKGR